MYSESMPLVTIGVASYNNSMYIIETLDSINNQIYSNLELVIVDDCSKDNSINVIENWVIKAKHPVKFIRNKENLGLTKVCNIILKNADINASYLAIIGSDDIMLNERILKQVTLLEQENPNTAAAFSDMIVIDAGGNTIDSSYFSAINEDIVSLNQLFVQDRNTKLAALINKNVIPAPAVLYKKIAAEKIGGWDESLNFEDWDFNLRLIKAGFTFLPEATPLIKYRKLAHSLSGKPSSASYESLLKLVSKHRNINYTIDKAIDKKIIECANIIYQYGGKTSLEWLIQKLKLTWDFKTLIFLIFAFFKIPYSKLRKIK